MAIFIVIAISTATFFLAFIMIQIDQSLELARLATARAEAAELALDLCKRELGAIKSRKEKITPNA